MSWAVRAGYPEFDPDQPRGKGGKWTTGRGSDVDESFASWFEGSVVVDADGNPRVVYHGAGSVFSEFNTSTGAWFTALPSVASNYTKGAAEVVVPAYLSIKNPASYDDWRDAEDAVLGQFRPVDPETGREQHRRVAVVEHLEGLGFDGLILRPDDPHGNTTFVVFRPNQIKSATGNRGTFDPENPDVRFGYPEFDPNQDRASDGKWTTGGGGKKFGPKPKFPFDMDWYNSHKTDEEKAERDAKLKAHRDAEKKWTRDIEHAMATGEISFEEAVKLGYPSSNRNNPWKPLPEKLWHVTTARDAVIANGLLTRDEVDGVGLGGGDSDTISFTDDRKIADGIYEAMMEARAVARGDKTVAMLVEEARTGAFTEFGQEYLSDAIRATGGIGSQEWKMGDPYPMEIQALLSGKKIVPMNEMSAWGIADAGYEPLPGGPSWWGVDSAGDPLEYFHFFWRDATPEEKLNGSFQFFKNTAFFRQHKEGAPMDPLFFLADPAYLARLEPEDIAILEYDGTGGYGYQVSALGEWRTTTGDAVEYVGEVPTDETQVRFGILGGYPEFDPSQQRASDGKWTTGRNVFVDNNLKRWLGKSVVRDVVYHATSAMMKAPWESDDKATALEISKFRHETHFGTAEAANARFKEVAAFDEHVGRPHAWRVKPVYLKIENPYQMPDLASQPNVWDVLDSFGPGHYEASDIQAWIDEWASSSLGADFRPMSWESLNDQDLFDYLKYIADEDIDESYRDNVWQWFTDYGYDGIAYENAVEDKGSISWIIFDPKQVKSATGNSGRFDPDVDDIRGGYPEFDENQTRAADGKWSKQGGGKSTTDLIDEIVANEGFTYSPVTLDSPSEGYVLSPYPDNGKVFEAGEISGEGIADYIGGNIELLNEENHYVGGWLDTETGKVHLDISIVLDNEADAVKLAKERNQIAIWVLHENREIRTGGTGSDGDEDIAAAAKGGRFVRIQFRADADPDEVAREIRKLMGDKLKGGYPEFDPGQQRDEDGRWTSGGEVGPFPDSVVQQVVYHQTNALFKKFKPGGLDPTLSGRAIWFGSNPEYLPQAHNRGGALRVIPTRINLQNPLYIDEFNVNEMAERWGIEDLYYLPDDAIDRLKAAGFDGIINELSIEPDERRDMPSNIEYVVFDPKQIRNAITGQVMGGYPEFDPTQQRDASGKWTQSGLFPGTPGLGDAGRAAKARRERLTEIVGYDITDPDERYEDFGDALDYLDSDDIPDDIHALLEDMAEEYGVNIERVEGLTGSNGEEFYRLLDEDEWKWVIVSDGDPVYPLTIGNWSDVREMFDVQAMYPELWELRGDDIPNVAWHGTDEENVASILEDGLSRSADTRGMSNRHIGFAVFASTDWEGTFRSYGDHTFEIDLAAMKRDGFIEFVSREPGIAEDEAYSSLFWQLTDGEGNYESESWDGLGPDTVIIHESIPVRYLHHVSPDDRASGLP